MLKAIWPDRNVQTILPTNRPPEGRSGTKQSWNTMSWLPDPRMPRASQLSLMFIPGLPPGTMAVARRKPLCGSPTRQAIAKRVAQVTGSQDLAPIEAPAVGHLGRLGHRVKHVRSRFGLGRTQDDFALAI